MAELERSIYSASSVLSDGEAQKRHRAKKRKKPLQSGRGNNEKDPRPNKNNKDTWISRTVVCALIGVVIFVLILNAVIVLFPTYQNLPEMINHFGSAALGALIGYFAGR